MKQARSREPGGSRTPGSSSSVDLEAPVGTEALPRERSLGWRGGVSVDGGTGKGESYNVLEGEKVRS